MSRMTMASADTTFHTTPTTTRPSSTNTATARESRSVRTASPRQFRCTEPQLWRGFLPVELFMARSESSRADRSEESPLFDRGGKRAFIEVVEFAADRDSVCKPRHFHVGILQQFGDVVGGGLPIDRGIEREDHLLHCRVMCT